MLSDTERAEIRALKDQYGEARSALMPAFWVAQRAHGHVTKDAVNEIAHLIGVDAGYASGVLSFYTMYQDKPVGRYVVQVCRTLSCAMAGSESILEHLKGKLGIDVGETTEDGRFTLLTAECLAACGYGPAMLVNDDLHEHLTPERVDEILDGLAD